MIARRLRFPVLVLVALAAAPLARAEVPGDAVRRFAEANDLFRSALELRAEDAPAARDRFERAAAMYQSIAQRHAIDNHLLHTNAGNAWLFAGEHGRAIAAYRRALRVDPGHEAAREGLAAARSLVRTSIPPDVSTRAEDAVLFWRSFVGRETVATVGVVCYAVFWLALTLHLVSGRSTRWPFTALTLLIAVYALGSLAMDVRGARSGREVVVTAGEVTGRNGPDAAAYEPTFATPLTEGVEATVLERRRGWARIRLGDARTTWIPVGALEVI